jgi:hypothetical protein
VPGRAAEYDVSARPITLIPPGTAIGPGAPQGWSHLIVKSHPRVADADRKEVTGLVARLASFLFTVTLADVRPEPDGRRPRFRIRDAAIGMGTRVNGQDVVLSPDTARQFGADLGWIERTILDTGFKRQQHGVVVFHGPTLLLFDTPVPFRCGARHRLVTYRYALLADADTGRLDPLVWLRDADCQSPRPPAEWLPPDLSYEPELRVDSQEFTLGVPSEVGLAVDRLPPGRAQLALPPELLPLAGQPRYTPESARQLEDELRRLLTSTGAMR